MLLERDGDTIFINLQDKPWQLMQALEAFQVSSDCDSQVWCVAIYKFKPSIDTDNFIAS